MDWYQAFAFCCWLGPGYTLPREAQWEYACRAGSTKAYCRIRVGDGDGWRDLDNEEELAVVAWVSKNSDGRTHPVREKEPNYWGLYDMHGNVWEWCLDWYHATLPGGEDPEATARAGASKPGRKV